VERYLLHLSLEDN